jgi:two-component system, NtrC family, response regulator GlrR
MILLLHSNSAMALKTELQEVLAKSLGNDAEPLHHKGIVSASFESAGSLPEIIKSPEAALILLVLTAQQLEHSVEILTAIRKLVDLPIIVVYESTSPDNVIEMMRNGANDFITVPLNAVNVLPRVRRLLDNPLISHDLDQSLKVGFGKKRLIGQSAAFVEVVKKISILAKCDVNVLVAGETGTGKELCARFIHYLSSRSTGPFIPINCGAIPENLVENELFGHRRGAYTSANTSQEGLIYEADGGTLFLDEVDSMPLAVQIKLLRFLQEKEYRVLGSTQTRMSDARILVATNTDVEAAVKLGKLREDFYYRIGVMSVTLPPLRHRQEDLPLLARHFLAKYSVQFGKQIADISPDAIRLLLLYDWPGNIRQLEHVIEGAVVLCEERTLQARHIILPQAQRSAAAGSFKEMKAKAVDEFEKNYINSLLLAHQGNISRAAVAAQKDRRSFFELMRKHKINPRHYRSPESR